MQHLLPQHDPRLDARRAALAQRGREYVFTKFNDLPIGREFYERDKAGARWVTQLLGLIHHGRSNLEAYLEASGVSFLNPLPQHSAAELGGALARKDFPFLLKHYLPDLGPMEGGGRPASIEEYRRIFCREKLPKVADVFMEDWVFARSFVAGPNPVLLTRLDAAMETFPVTDEHFRCGRPFQADSLHEALSEGRVFVVDFSGLRTLRPGQHPLQPKYLAAPQVMLALPRGGRSLVPIAISGGPDANAPIWTPSDGWAWQIAKQAVRVADGCHQELLSHLAYTHLVIESFVVATRRCLAESHPVYALLSPHYEGTMPINALAIKKLIQPGEAVDRVVGAEVSSIYEVLRQERLAFNLAENYVPNALRRRKVDDVEALPDYPYRDDALQIWGAISRWVSGYVDHYYRCDSDVQEDDELQRWTAELADPDAGAIVGLGRHGRIEDRETLKEVLTMVIFTASAQHAAINFAQLSEMAFSPAYPLALYAPLPTAGSVVTEQDFLDVLPPLDVALRTEQTLVFLGSLHYGQLGHYPARHFRSSEVVALMKRFQDELRDIEAKIVERNEGQILPYVHLQPTRVPQSINI